MEDLRTLIQNAQRNLSTADHLLYVTYPLLKDKHLIIQVAENIFLSLENSIKAFLYYERMFKRIPNVAEGFNIQFEMFKHRYSKLENLQPENLEYVRDLKMILDKHKKSTVEFMRNEKFIMYSSIDDVKTLTVDQLKSYLKQTKPIVEKVKNLTLQHV